MFKPQSLIHGGFEVHFDAFHPIIYFILSNLSLPKTIFCEGVLLIQDYNINFMWVGVRLCVNSDNWIAIIILNRKLWIEEENHVLSQLQDIGQVCIQYFITNNTLIFIGSYMYMYWHTHVYWSAFLVGTCLTVIVSVSSKILEMNYCILGYFCSVLICPVLIQFIQTK